MGLVTLIFDRLILKVVCDSRLSCGTVFPNFGTLGLRVLELFAITRRTDRRTDVQKQCLLSLPYSGGA